MDVQSDQTRKPGTFAKGHDPRRVIPLERKPKGPNKIARDLKKGIMDAAERHGEDGLGTNGIEGYCFLLASKHPKIFAQLLGKVLPMQIHASVDNYIASVNIVSIPSDSYLAPEDIARIKQQPQLELEAGGADTLEPGDGAEPGQDT
jgi:hypothetical protein